MDITDADQGKHMTDSTQGQSVTDALSHDEAIDALISCAQTVTVLSYQEVIQGYFKLRNIDLAALSAAPVNTTPAPASEVTDLDEDVQQAINECRDADNKPMEELLLEVQAALTASPDVRAIENAVIEECDAAMWKAVYPVNPEEDWTDYASILAQAARLAREAIRNLTRTDGGA